MARRPKFKFLTMEEFRALPPGEKLVYIEEAMEEIKAMRGNVPENIIFEDSPPPKTPHKGEQ